MRHSNIAEHEHERVCTSSARRMYGLAALKMAGTASSSDFDMMPGQVWEGKGRWTVGEYVSNIRLNGRS
jgi:hypothetical protein